MHEFCSSGLYCNDGLYRAGQLLVGSDGNIYGATSQGGAGAGCDRMIVAPVGESGQVVIGRKRLRVRRISMPPPTAKAKKFSDPAKPEAAGVSPPLA